MKALILYASKYGCVETCVKYLKEKLNAETVMANIKDAGKLELKGFGFIIIGGSITAGSVSKKLKKFCAANLDVLLSKNIALFLSCADSDRADEYFAKNFPSGLLKNAKKTAFFGGSLNWEKYGFLIKVLMKQISKSKKGAEPQILYGNIDELAMTVNALCG